MSHMVIYRGVDGKPGYHQTDDIHDAVSFVEQMRNEEGVEHARIFRLEEVVFEYRPYYRVELTDAAGVPASNGLAEGEVAAAQVGSGAEADEPPLEDAVEVVEATTADDGGAGADADGDHGEQNGASENGEVKADAGAGKKGLFGR